MSFECTIKTDSMQRVGSSIKLVYIACLYWSFSNSPNVWTVALDLGSTDMYCWLNCYVSPSDTGSLQVNGFNLVLASLFGGAPAPSAAPMAHTLKDMRDAAAAATDRAKANVLSSVHRT